MKNKVYYGELFKEGQFVRPVTIALFYGTSEKVNLILDGQQRLTSFLLTYLVFSV